MLTAYFGGINRTHWCCVGHEGPSQASTPRSCSQRPTASPPCASGESYPERPCPRGGWACSRARGATAPRAPAEGARRCAAGWPGWGRGWRWGGGTPRCSTWRGRSHPSRSPGPDLEPAAGWNAGCRRSPVWSDGPGPGQRGPLMSGPQLQLQFCHSGPRSKKLFLVSDLEKTKGFLEELQEASVAALKAHYLLEFDILCCSASRQTCTLRLLILINKKGERIQPPDPHSPIPDVSRRLCPPWTHNRTTTTFNSNITEELLLFLWAMVWMSAGTNDAQDEGLQYIALRDERGGGWRDDLTRSVGGQAGVWPRICPVGII